jgi:ribosomal protein L34E
MSKYFTKDSKNTVLILMDVTTETMQSMYEDMLQNKAGYDPGDENTIMDNDIGNMSLPTNIPKKYKPLPSVFKGLQKWPRTSNLLCCNCGIPFDSIPVFIPTSYMFDDSKGKSTMDTFGNYCSFNCAMSDIVNRFRFEDRHEKIYMLSKLYAIFNDCSEPSSIACSADKIQMKAYGGHLTPIEWREFNASKNIL